ncbi:3-deoxy-7-phosphoheptulonate synthase [Clostridiaceae bacterium 35-E11]
MEVRMIGKQNGDKTKIMVKDVELGGQELVLIAGPCAIESEKQILDTAVAMKKAGAKILRGGAFKPRTSPYSFQGLGEEGLQYIYKAGQITDMPVISEVMDTRDVETVYKYVDILQIGSRNMQNYSLLKEVGKTDKPVMLKRGMAASIEDWLLAAEYIAYEGNRNIILCERGIRTFETYTRNTLDLMAVPIVKQHTHLPVFVDPSHGTGRRELIESAAIAAVAVGANGLMIEVHPCPCDALSDGIQSINFNDFEKLSKKLLMLQTCLDTIKEI